ncbi:prostasin-like [Palaemon carinicauda]|uniref:prostasin-like n=1 Tax=Palaemon carinicauda TaxID=392227 RepID=UPI0035B60D90
MAFSVFSSVCPASGQVYKYLLLFCVTFLTGTQARRFSASRSAEASRYRHEGYPKFPLDVQPLPLPSRSFFPCGLKVSPRIVGGSVSAYGDHPWMITIGVYDPSRKDFSHQCGGALITSTHILTAAHCITEFTKGLVRITAGDHSLSTVDEGEQIFAVEDWQIHPNFTRNGRFSDDLAVVKILPKSGEGFQMSRFVVPVCLPSESFTYTDKHTCRVSGWGFTDPSDDNSKSDLLLDAEIPILQEQKCKDINKNDFSPGMICAGYLEGRIDACNGDSGGPLVCEIDGKHTLIGIVSWGIKCARPNSPGIYTSTQYYLDWILAVIDQL